MQKNKNKNKNDMFQVGKFCRHLRFMIAFHASLRLGG
jgi:hypothetical protein